MVVSISLFWIVESISLLDVVSTCIRERRESDSIWE